MTRDITPIKWIIGAIAFLIIVAGACYLWYRYDTAPYKQEAAEAIELAHQWELAQKADTKSERNAEQADDVPTESNTQSVEKLITERTTPANTKDVVSGESQSVAAGMPSVENTEPIRVSPHGFGPYPKIPEGAPIAEFNESDDVEMELLLRVSVKAWNEGKRFLGSSTDNGKVYLHYPNTVYVEYRTVINWDGTFRKRFTSALSGNIHLTPQQMRDGQVPPGIRILELDKEGINPYEYLDLP